MKPTALPSNTTGLLRSKGQVHSVLDDIPGIGPGRRKELMRRYQSLEEIRKAEVEELKALPSMNERGGPFCL